MGHFKNVSVSGMTQHLLLHAVAGNNTLLYNTTFKAPKSFSRLPALMLYSQLRRLFGSQ